MAKNKQPTRKPAGTFLTLRTMQKKADLVRRDATMLALLAQGRVHNATESELGAYVKKLSPNARPVANALFGKPSSKAGKAKAKRLITWAESLSEPRALSPKHSG